MCAAPEPAAGPSPGLDLRVGVPGPALFPLSDWRRLVTQELSRRPAAGYADPAGHAGLRAAIARPGVAVEDLGRYCAG